jgi:hypothetical protein
MTSPNVVRYRPPRARIAVAYSTKDRVDLTRITVAPLIDDPALDLYWFDGSATEAGQQLPLQLCAGRAAICELHQGVVGGPDRAIMYALQTLRGYAYDLVILVENDVLLSDGWFQAMCASIGRAEAAGFQVGAATVRVFAQRVLSFNDEYCLMLNSGAGFIALTPAAVDIVLANYRTLDGAEFIRCIRHLTAKDVSATLEFGPLQPLSVDFIFDLMLYLHGYVVAAPPVTYAHMIDDAPARGVKLVTAPGQHLPQVRCLITGPDQIGTAGISFSRFQKSPLSDRLLIGCHRLRVGVNSVDASQPVLLAGTWRRTWMQALGPFGLTGVGKISFTVGKATIGLLLYSGPAGAELCLLGPDGTILSAVAIKPGTLVDIPFNAAETQTADGTCTQDIVLQVATGEICLVGVTANAADTAGYANDHPTVDHLPP